MNKKPLPTHQESLQTLDEGNETPVRILIVEDEEDASITLEELLKMKNYEVQAVANAKEALEILAISSFDLIISDLLMPKTDGIALTKAVREMGIETPLVVMTGFASVEHAVESMKAGASDFITKPFNADQIQIIINRTLNAKRLEKLAQEREFYKNLSNIDGLTDLSNYRYFYQLLESEIERQKRYKRPVSLMMIDVDNFKSYNDKFGHLIGDLILKQIAFLIKKATRGCDFVARYGGEEFVVILPETPEKEAAVLGERILLAIEQFEFQTPEGQDIGKVTVTIGVATYPADAQGQKELIEKSDQALYQGKRAGKNCIVVYGAQNIRAVN